MPEKAKLFKINLRPEALAVIGRSDSLAGRVHSIIARYGEIIRRSMPTLSEGEWCAIADVANGMHGLVEAGLDADPMVYLAQELADSAEDGLAEKWSIDLPALVAKVAVMNYAELMAIAEVCRWFWTSEQLNELPAGELLRQCGARIEG